MHTPRLTALLRAIDDINRTDPNQVEHQGQTIAKELLYSQRMTQHLQAFAPDASELLQIAAHAQHIKRWHLPRSDFPQNRSGYKSWRSELARFHAQLTAELMATAGYASEEQLRVGALLQKKQLKRDPEVQTLEDVICLVFIEHYLTDFAAKHSEEKLISIIQKTWTKMSEQGQQAALKLPLSDDLLNLIGKALAPRTP